VSPPAPTRDAWLRALLWLWLGAWIGAMALFGSLTRVAFEVVPQPEVAGQLVGRLLGPLLTIGGVSGIGLAALAATLGRGVAAVIVPLVLAIACLINRFGVAGAVAEIRLTDPGLGPELATRFATLHRLSVVLFMGTLFGAVLLAAIHAGIEVRRARGLRPSGAKSS
jgi:hypothetical protein